MAKRLHKVKKKEDRRKKGAVARALWKVVIPRSEATKNLKVYGAA